METKKKTYTPQRMCVSCKKRCEKDKLVRISVLNNAPAVDMKKANSSRAIYVCKNERCIEILKKSKAIERFLGVKTDLEFYDSLKNCKF